MMDPKRQRTVGVTSVVLVALFSLACATPSPAPPPRVGTYSEYRVGAPDELFIVIFPDPVIQRSARVRPDGMISLDLIGDVGLLAPTPANAMAGEGLGGWIGSYMWSLGIAIAGGTANVQRNVIAERGLGLPRDAAANRSH